MMCAKCYEQGKTACDHIGQTVQEFKREYEAKAPTNSTGKVLVKMLAYVSKQGGRLHFVREGDSQPADLVRLSNLDQYADVPTPKEETASALPKCIMFGLEERRRDMMNFADGTYSAHIVIKDGKPYVTVKEVS